MKFYIDKKGELYREDDASIDYCGWDYLKEEEGWKEYHGVVLRCYTRTHDFGWGLATLYNLRKSINKGRQNYCNSFVTPEEFKRSLFTWTVKPDRHGLEIEAIDELKQLGDKYYFTV